MMPSYASRQPTYSCQSKSSFHAGDLRLFKTMLGHNEHGDKEVGQRMVFAVVDVLARLLFLTKGNLPTLRLVLARDGLPGPQTIRENAWPRTRQRSER